MWGDDEPGCQWEEFVTKCYVYKLKRLLPECMSMYVTIKLKNSNSSDLNLSRIHLKIYFPPPPSPGEIFGENVLYCLKSFNLKSLNE